MASSIVAISMMLMSAASVHASTFLGSHPHEEMQQIPTQEVEQMLLSELASYGNDSRISDIAVELRPLYVALPKNDRGNLEPSVVRYALHRYFAQKYGWHFRGLEPRGGAQNASSTAAILMDRTPSYIMETLEERLHGVGLDLEALATFAVTLIDLVRKEAVSDMEGIFGALGTSKESRVSKDAMESLLKNYLMTYITGQHTPRSSPSDFVEMEKSMVSDVIVWFDAKMWADDLRLASLHTQLSRRNPFVNEHTFDDVVAAAQEIGQHFGTFQNRECTSLKARLVDMEFRGSGRVLLSKFYGNINDDMDWPFIESVDYLRNIGALDESDPRRLSVIIPNFLSSPSNCETPSNFYSVCCIDECEGLLAQVEIAVGEPSASVPSLVEVISGLPSVTVAAPRNLSSVLVDRLDEIAKHHGGLVPLHGRLFAQWMHHAYPRECRYPHVAGSISPLTQREYQDKFGILAEASDEELELHLNNAPASSEDEDESDEELAVTLPWSHEEELIVPSVLGGTEEVVIQAGWSSLRLLALVALVVSAGVPALNSVFPEQKAEKFSI